MARPSDSARLSWAAVGADDSRLDAISFATSLDRCLVRVRSCSGLERFGVLILVLTGVGVRIIP